MAGEAADISNLENLSLVLRFLTPLTKSEKNLLVSFTVMVELVAKR